MMLQHEFPVAGALVEKLSFLLEFDIGATALDSELGPGTPLLDQSLHSI